MKKTKHLLAMLVLLLSACNVEDINPIKLEGVEYGAFARTIQVTSGSFLFNRFDNFLIEGTQYELEIELSDLEQGNLIETVDLYLKHRRGPTVSNEVKFSTLTLADFTVNEVSGLPRRQIVLLGSNALSVLGMTNADLAVGDAFELRVELTMKDGRKFTNSNASGPIGSTAFFASPFLYRIPLACESSYAGTYEYTTTNITAGAGGGSCESASGTITLSYVEGSPGVYQIDDPSFGVFDCAWGDSSPNDGLAPSAQVRFNELCATLSFSGTDKYGDRYSITSVSVDGNALTFDWENSYGDGGRTTLINPNGNWPEDLN